MTDVTYDTAVYDVTVRVTGTEAGELEAVVWCEKEGQKENRTRSYLRIREKNRRRR